MNRALAALRRVLRFAWREGSLPYETYLRLSDVEPVRGEALPRGRALQPAELEALYGACAQDVKPSGRRDGLVIGLLHASGLRAAEAAGLQLEDVVNANLGELLVTGKGGFGACASLGAAAPLLGAWLAIRGDDPGPLLLQVRATGKIAPAGLCPRALFQVVRKRALEAGLRRTTAHDLRRTYATELLRAGNDHLLVARALRHHDVRSLRSYDRRPAEEIAAAQRAAIHVPASARSGGRNP